MVDELTIKPLTTMPKTKAKVKKKTELRKLIEQFDQENMKYAEIPVTKDHSARGIRVGIGRILAKDDRADIETYESLDGKSVILKRK